MLLTRSGVFSPDSLLQGLYRIGPGYTAYLTAGYSYTELEGSAKRSTCFGWLETIPDSI